MLKQYAARGVRALHNSAVARQSLPSSSEMKLDKLWTKSLKPLSNSDLIGMARQIQESAQPPLEIAPRFTTNFRAGEALDPFDFSHHRVNMNRKADAQRRKDVVDPFERSGIDPLTLYTMPRILSQFLTSTGQILPRSVTGCSAKNQKKLSNAIKTARAIGMLSSTHKHISFLPKRLT